MSLCLLWPKRSSRPPTNAAPGPPWSAFDRVVGSQWHPRHMRLKRRAAMYRASATESLTLAIELFNRPHPAARGDAVVIMAAQACEMLLKALIFQRRGTVLDPSTGLSWSLKKAINIALDDLKILSPEEAVVLRSLKQDRDVAAHDLIEISDDLLWVHMRSIVTIFHRLLREELQDDSPFVGLPARVLPVSATAPTDMGLLVEEEIQMVRDLLAPGRRRSTEAAMRLRPLLALDGSVTGRADAPTEKEVQRASRALAGGKDWRVVLPGLATLQLVRRPPADSGAAGGAREIVLRIGRGAEALPVKRVAPDDEGALAYRDSNPFDDYGIKLSTFGERLGLTRTEGYAVIEALKLKDDDRSYFAERTKSGNVIFQGLSARAKHLAEEALEQGLDVEAAVAAYKAAHRRRSGDD